MSCGVLCKEMSILKSMTKLRVPKTHVIKIIDCTDLLVLIEYIMILLRNIKKLSSYFLYINPLAACFVLTD